jgi:hypothetical protein
MKIKEKFIKYVWNNIGFWRLQFFIDLAIFIILIFVILYLLGEYKHVVNELLKCMALGD